MSEAALTPLRGGPLVTATVGIAVLTAMTVLDSTIANVALSTIAGNLGVAVSQGTWVITFFGVANAVAIPLTGWLARRMGEVRLYFVASALFVLSSFLCGISSSLGMLIFFRLLQGVAAGPILPLSQSLLLACYPPEKRGIAAEGVGGPAVRVRQPAAVAPHDAGLVHACTEQGNVLFFADQLFPVSARPDMDLCPAVIWHGQHCFGHRSKIAAAVLRHGNGKHLSVLPFCFYASIVYLLPCRKSTKFV